MLSKLENRDIEETLRLEGVPDFEEAIFLAMEKVEALCRVQSELEAGEAQVPQPTRMYYALILQEHVEQLRTLLTKHFD